MSDEARRRAEKGDTYPDGSSRYQDEPEAVSKESMDEEGINWQEQCQDQTDLLKRALGRERSLAERIKVKDEAHRKDIVILQAEITRLEQERAELPGQIAARQAELAATPAENKTRREMLEWQIRRVQERMADVTARLAAISTGRG